MTATQECERVAAMKAVGYRASLPVTDPDVLLDVEVPVPEPRPRDLLVAVQAIGVNPVDAKARMRTSRNPVK